MCCIPSPVTFSPTKLNLVLEVSGHRESFLMRLSDLLPGSKVGYLRRAPLSYSENISTCPCQKSNPGRWIYRQTLYHVTVKAGSYCNAVEVCCIPSPVTFSPTKLNVIAEVPGHRESFPTRLREVLPGSSVGYFRWSPLS